MCDLYGDKIILVLIQNLGESVNSYLILPKIYLSNLKKGCARNYVC